MGLLHIKKCGRGCDETETKIQSLDREHRISHFGRIIDLPEYDVHNTTKHFLLHCRVHMVSRNKLSGALPRIGVALDLKNLLFPSKALHTFTFLAHETYLLDCQMTDKI